MVYNRFAESSRVNWTLEFAENAKRGSKEEWLELMSPRSIGLILKSIRTDYKFVSAGSRHALGYKGPQLLQS